MVKSRSSAVQQPRLSRFALPSERIGQSSFLLLACPRLGLHRADNASFGVQNDYTI